MTIATQAFDQSLRIAGFDLAPENDPSAHHVILVVGDTQYLEDFSRHIGDQYGVDFFSLFNAKDHDKNTSVFFDPCYLGTKNRNHGMTYIFVKDDYAKVCLPRLFFAVAGLNETAGPVASITSTDGQYYSATLADLSFISVLYSEKVPLDGDKYRLHDYYLNLILHDQDYMNLLVESNE